MYIGGDGFPKYIFLDGHIQPHVLTRIILDPVGEWYASRTRSFSATLHNYRQGRFPMCLHVQVNPVSPELFQKWKISDINERKDNRPLFR